MAAGRAAGSPGSLGYVPEHNAATPLAPPIQPTGTDKRVQYSKTFTTFI